MKKICILLTALFMAFYASAASLPMDTFEGGKPLDEAGFVSLTEDGGGVYSDESITANVWKETTTYNIDGKRYNVVFWVADVTITDPSQLRTAIAGNINGVRTNKFDTMSKRVNAVVSANGDYYGLRQGCYTVKQSTVLNKINTTDLDVLIIDYDSNFNLFPAAERDKALEDMKGSIYQCFTFGPILVKDGVLYTDFSHADETVHVQTMNPRTAIGQLGPLHYLIAVVEGRNGNSCGVTMQQLAEYMYGKGCVQAYNLDGGSSSQMYFHGKPVSAYTGQGERSLNDIIYFASIDS